MLYDYFDRASFLFMLHCHKLCNNNGTTVFQRTRKTSNVPTSASALPPSVAPCPKTPTVLGMTTLSTHVTASKSSSLSDSQVPGSATAHAEPTNSQECANKIDAILQSFGASEGISTEVSCHATPQNICFASGKRRPDPQEELHSATLSRC